MWNNYAQTNGLRVVGDELCVMQTICKVINQTVKKLGDELLRTLPENEEEGKLDTPILIAARNGIKEMVKRVNNLTVTIFSAVDDNGNSVLHLDVMFTNPRPWLTRSAALQMQWEAKWFHV